jgi:hypothetical protein
MSQSPVFIIFRWPPPPPPVPPLPPPLPPPKPAPPPLQPPPQSVNQNRVVVLGTAAVVIGGCILIAFLLVRGGPSQGQPHTRLRAGC